MTELPLLYRATAGDYPAVADLLAQSARWMHERGWTAWPPGGFPPGRIMPGIEAGEVWVLSDGGRPVGTITLDQKPEQEFSASEAVAAGVTELLPHAWIGHRLAVARDKAGLGYGTLLVRWSVDFAARSGATWRLTNVARRAVPLQSWYRRHGFGHLATVTSTRTAEGAPRQSGYLMGRAVSTTPELAELVTELG